MFVILTSECFIRPFSDPGGVANVPVQEPEGPSSESQCLPVTVGNCWLCTPLLEWPTFLLESYWLCRLLLQTSCNTPDPANQGPHEQLISRIGKGHPSSFLTVYAH